MTVSGLITSSPIVLSRMKMKKGLKLQEQLSMEPNGRSQTQKYSELNMLQRMSWIDSKTRTNLSSSPRRSNRILRRRGRKKRTPSGNLAARLDGGRKRRRRNGGHRLLGNGTATKSDNLRNARSRHGEAEVGQGHQEEEGPGAGSKKIGGTEETRKWKRSPQPSFWMICLRKPKHYLVSTGYHSQKNRQQFRIRRERKKKKNKRRCGRREKKMKPRDYRKEKTEVRGGGTTAGEDSGPGAESVQSETAA
mmetsp:Transcript_1337/g.1725  ORF Transcript_1337/g.1725 Transcript_1337/m.1725 type:complete len:249 (-) Transcript_1337:248-994(-)